MSDFSTPDDTDEWGLPPSEANFIEPGKRPTSSMSPTLITDRQGQVRGMSYISNGLFYVSQIYVSVNYKGITVFSLKQI